MREKHIFIYSYMLLGYSHNETEAHFDLQLYVVGLIT